MFKKTIGFACAAACLGAFGAPTFGVVDGKYVIDPDACISCGNCEANCPAGVIAED